MRQWKIVSCCDSARLEFDFVIEIASDSCCYIIVAIDTQVLTIAGGIAGAGVECYQHDRVLGRAEFVYDLRAGCDIEYGFV